ncbi:MAG TPA: hypothetical protein VGF67_05615, partial [Ktedonobacteraceae bacterium]
MEGEQPTETASVVQERQNYGPVFWRIWWRERLFPLQEECRTAWETAGGSWMWMALDKRPANGRCR